MADEPIFSLDSRGRDFTIEFNLVRDYKWIKTRHRLNFEMILYLRSPGHLPGADYGTD
jgi:hypothetical protein